MRLAKLLPLVLLAILLVGCNNQPKIAPESITQLREYSLDNVSFYVGIGKWMPNGSFVIETTDGRSISADPECQIYESPVTLDSFSRVTRD